MKFLLLVFGIFQINTQFAFASQQLFLINVDKGTLHLSFEDIKEPFRVRSVPAKFCDTELRVNSLPNMLTIKHDEKVCVSGRTMWLTLPLHQSVRLNMQAGVILVNHSKMLKKNFGFIEASVQAGVMESAVDFLGINTVPGSGSASYISSSNNGNKLIMSLDAGVLSFEN